MKHLLYVNDDAADLQLCKLALEKAGYEVLTAGNASTAIHAISSQPVDCAILDYHLPRLDGLAVAQAIKQIRPEVPICLFTDPLCVPKENNGMIDQVISKNDGPEALLEWLISFSADPIRLENGLEESRPPKR